MAVSTSPYALLRACAPQRHAYVCSPYDLYSTSQSDSIAQTPLPPADIPDMPKSPQSQRTHYIADIQSRHHAANKRCRAQQSPVT